jgi:hypothetical protein
LLPQPPPNESQSIENTEADLVNINSDVSDTEMLVQQPRLQDNSEQEFILDPEEIKA